MRRGGGGGGRERERERERERGREGGRERERESKFTCDILNRAAALRPYVPSLIGEHDVSSLLLGLCVAGHRGVVQFVQ